ncbi:MAG: glycosyltransferase family 2 protein [Lentisphaerae bacterium]|nr:glycosyltransferase family 2 protein [Lentisphaerota bacterium]
MAMREQVSVCCAAGNEEGNIRRCLESVTWADEIVVVDSLSTDRTVEIAREYTDKVRSQEWLGYVRQKALAIDLTAGPWVLLVDADEEVSPALRDEILAVLESDRSDRVAGYEFPRLARYQGRWIRHGDWYPQRKLRLFRKDRGRCAGQDPHDRIEVDGPVRRLRSPLNHYSHRDIRGQIATLNKFSSISADEHAEEGRTFCWFDILVRPPWRFFRSYILRLGFLGGIRGLLIAKISAFEAFIKYAKLWERTRSESDSDRDES